MSRKKVPGIPFIELPHSSPEMDAALDNLDRAFAKMPCPAPERFRYDFDASSPYKKIPELEEKRRIIFAILGESEGASINTSNIMQVKSLSIYMEKDAFLYILPKMLRASLDWWKERVAEEPTVAAAFLAKRQPIALADWRENALAEYIFFTTSMFNDFCDLRGRPINLEKCHRDRRYEIEQRAEKAKIIAPYMTKAMRRTLKAYIVAWCKVFGQVYYEPEYGPKNPIQCACYIMKPYTSWL